MLTQVFKTIENTVTFYQLSLHHFYNDEKLGRKLEDFFPLILSIKKKGVHTWF